MSKTQASQQSRPALCLLKNSMLVLPLGGAAVYRCDQRPIFSAGFSR
jgi:hypothetical protein